MHIKERENSVKQREKQTKTKKKQIGKGNIASYVTIHLHNNI